MAARSRSRAWAAAATRSRSSPSKYARADHVVSGTYTGSASAPSVTIQLLDVASGRRLVMSLAADGLAELGLRAGDALRNALAAPALSQLDRHELAVAVPRDPEVARAYFEGLDRLRVAAAASRSGRIATTMPLP